jgi:hypothetical protein
MRSVLIGTVLAAVAAGAVYWFAFDVMAPVYDGTALIERGVLEDAEIISAVKTGDEYQGESVYELELQVRSGEGRGYRAFHKQPFAKSDEPHLQKTAKVRVKVDPDEKRELWVVETGVREFEE